MNSHSLDFLLHFLAFYYMHAHKKNRDPIRPHCWALRMSLLTFHKTNLHSCQFLLKKTISSLLSSIIFPTLSSCTVAPCAATCRYSIAGLVCIVSESRTQAWAYINMPLFTIKENYFKRVNEIASVFPLISSRLWPSTRRMISFPRMRSKQIMKLSKETKRWNSTDSAG